MNCMYSVFFESIPDVYTCTRILGYMYVLRVLLVDFHS